MASATRLESGSWRAQASKTINGVKVRKSFTVRLNEVGGDWRKAKAKAELLAREWTLNKKAEIYSKPIVKDAMERYIEHRKNVLSERTLYDYMGLIKFFKPIHDINLENLTNEDIQKLVNDWSVKLTKKTITNRLSFLSATLEYFKVDNDFNLSVSETKNPSIPVVSPQTEEVKLLLDNAEGELKAAIALAAFGSLRRGEICALKQKDIFREDCLIYIHADFVQARNEEGESVLIYKDPPKTKNSIRTIELPDFVIDMLPKSDNPESFVFGFTINALESAFRRYRNKLGLSCTIHSLRHFAASFRSDLQIPTKYIEQVGGWKHDSRVLKNVYDNKLLESSKKYNKLANEYVKEVFFAEKAL